jgi:hypothetical protein
MKINATANKVLSMFLGRIIGEYLSGFEGQASPHLMGLFKKWFSNLFNL